jgi:hypothetical protein
MVVPQIAYEALPVMIVSKEAGYCPGSVSLDCNELSHIVSINGREAAQSHLDYGARAPTRVPQYIA